MNYYNQQLAKLNLNEGIIFKLSSQEYAYGTNWMSLNENSAKALIEFLNNFLKEESKNGNTNN